MVRMSDIAAHLGLSRLTVSAVLNGRAEAVGISEETAARVREAARKLGYHRNHLALAMKTGKNPVIGCIVSDLKAEWTSGTLSGLLKQTHASGYAIKIEEVYGKESEETALSRFLEQRVAGIFCCNFNPSTAFVERFNDATQQYAIPAISSLSRKDLTAAWIDSDDAQGITLAIDHLWQLGHRKIAFIGANSGERVREESFIHAMQARGATLPAFYLPKTGWDTATATEATAEILSRKKNVPTAFVCANDTLAAVVIRTARRLGYPPPQALSVVGFSNSRIGHFLDPELTSIAQPFEEIGQRCGRLLLELIEDKKGSYPSRELVPTQLVVRESTAPPRE